MYNLINALKSIRCPLKTTEELDLKLYSNKKYNTIAAYVLIVLAIGFVMAIALFKFPTILKVLSKFADILMPVIWGFAIAYILNPIAKAISKLLNKRVFSKKQMPKLTTAISVVIVELIFIAFILGVMSTIIPALINSISEIFANLTSMFSQLQEYAKSLFSDHPKIYSFISEKLSEYSTNAADLVEKAEPMLNNLVSGAWGFLGFLKDFVLGVIVSIYFLCSKDNLLAQIKKILLATLSKKKCERIFDIAKKSHTVFSGFITGKVLDSLIIGLIAVPCLLIMKVPYAVMIAVIIGITNVIPFFGPFIGAVPTGLLVLLVEPKKLIPFIIFVILLQQFDGNLLGPKILGDSTGLPAIWVLISLLVGGGLFGFAGMILSVPTFAVIYSLSRESIEKKLKKKKLPVSTSYYKNDIEHLYKTNPDKKPLTVEELYALDIPTIEEANEINQD